MRRIVRRSAVLAAVLALSALTGSSMASSQDLAEAAPALAPSVTSEQVEPSLASILPLAMTEADQALVCGDEFTCRQICLDDCQATFNACVDGCSGDFGCRRLCFLNLQDCSTWCSIVF